MTDKFADNQQTIGLLGIGLSVLIGLLIGAGQSRYLLFAMLALVLLVLALVGVWALVDDPTAVGFWLLGAAVLAVSWNAVRPAESATIADLFLVLAVPFALYNALDRSRRYVIPWWLLLGVGLLCLSVLVIEVVPGAELVETVASASGDFSFRNTTGSDISMGARLVLALALFPLVAAYLVTRWSQIRLLVNLWIVGACVTCLVAVLDAFVGLGLQQALGSPDVKEGAFGSEGYGDLSSGARYVGLAVHPVHLSLIAAMAIPVVLIRMEEPGASKLYLPVLLLLFGGILLSGSRTGIVLLVFIWVILFIWRPKSRRILLLAAMAAVGLLVASSLAGASLVSTRLSSSGTDVALSNARRLQLIDEGLANFINRPVTGYGFEVVRRAHNVPLQLLLAGGLAALTGYALVAWGYMRAGFRAVGRVPERISGDLAGLTVSFAVFLFAGLFGNYIFDRYLYVPAAIILAAGALLAMQGGGPVGQQHEHPHRR